jgi:DNA-directed RNA polymerase subunit RPC12/RpoP
VTIDICWDCHALWFDQFESAALAPGSVIDLFRLIHEHREKPARTLGEAMNCPRCRKRLTPTQDVLRTNRFAYHRCAEGHGRLITFLQFLREKEFVRSLTRWEIEGLRGKVKQVRCSSCGGAVDLAKDHACPYCRSPIAVLDAAAVEKTLAALTDAERLRTSPGPGTSEKAVEALLDRHRAKRGESVWTRDITPMQSNAALVDLLAEGIGRLFR